MKTHRTRLPFVPTDCRLVLVTVAMAGFVVVAAIVCNTWERNSPNGEVLDQGNSDSTRIAKTDKPLLIGEHAGASTRVEVDESTNPTTTPEAAEQAPEVESSYLDRVSELRSELGPEMLHRIDRFQNPYLDSTNDGRDLIELLTFGKAAELLLRSSRLLNPNGVALSQESVSRLLSTVIREELPRLRAESAQLGALALQRSQDLYEKATEGGVVGIGPEEQSGEYALTVVGSGGARVVRYAWGPDSPIHSERIQLRNRCLTAIEKIAAHVTASNTP